MCNYGFPYKIGRFLRKEWVKSGVVRPIAFLPRDPDKYPDQSIEVSCFEIQGLTEEQVFVIADENTPPILLNNKPPTGYCAFHQTDFPHGVLELDFNDSPSRHANIIGWPRNKEDWAELAQHLAEKASNEIILRP